MNDPDMTREARRRRQQAWEQGREWAKEISARHAHVYGTREEEIEFLRGVGQFFSGNAYDLTQERDDAARG